MTSPVREALYRGDRAAAEAAAEGAQLDVFDAAALGRVERLRELLDADSELVHELSDDGFTPLHLACFGAAAEAVRLLVERGAPLERLAEAPFARVRPLGTAVFAGNVDAARILLDAGADPNGTDSAEHRPLQTAEARGNEELVSLLRERGATLPA
jgi:ankyrin repeat protein